MKKVLIVATVQSHICQFHKPLVEILHESGIEVHVAARDNLSEKKGLKLDFVEKVFDIPFQRSPFSFKNIKAYKELKKIINDGNYDIIHCNTPVGGILTRMAAKKVRKKGTKIYYTAHGFHFYKGSQIKNWMLWYPIERHFARKCDKLITIVGEDFLLAKKCFKTTVERIHGVGVDENRYKPVSVEEKAFLRSNEKLNNSDYVVTCTGELNKNKDQKTLLKATELLKDKIPGLKVLLAGNGPTESELRGYIHDKGLSDNVKLLGYRSDLEKIVPCADLVVSCSLREGLGLNIIEAMLCAVPVVATHNRGHDELVDAGENGFLFAFGDEVDLADKIYRLFSDKELSNLFGKNGFAKMKAYTKDNVKNELRSIYFN